MEESLRMYKTKQCLVCTVYKPASDFNFCKRPYRQSICKPCQATYDRYIRAVNADKIRETNRLKYQLLTPAEKIDRQRNKKRVEVTCIECKRGFQKRADSLSRWKGRCNPCAARFTLNRITPEVRKQNGLQYIKRYGPPPGPKMENRGRGSTHYRWRGGITPFRIKLWQSPEYKAWRKAVFSRDGFECVACHKNTHDLQADHIKPFSLFPELRFDIGNGRTMCKPCHRKYGAKASCGKLIRAASFEYKETINPTPRMNEAPERQCFAK